MHAILLKSQ